MHSDASFSVLRALLVSLFISALCQASAAAIYAEGPPDPHPTVALLNSLGPHLDQVGIDVRIGATSAISDATLASRPQIASLASLPPPSGEMEAGTDGFARLFVKGAQMRSDDATPFLVAVGGQSGRRSVTRDQFQKIWDAAPSRQRLFLSFSSSDRVHAEAAAKALRAQGFVVFTYLQGANGSVWTNSVEAGRYLRGAGLRLVIDSLAARESPAIHVERAVARDLEGVEPLDAKTLKFQREIGNSAAGEPCCSFCYERAIQITPAASSSRACKDVFGPEPSAIRRNCSKKTCGIFCRNADALYDAEPSSIHHRMAWLAGFPSAQGSVCR